MSTKHIRGTFAVEMTPQQPPADSAEAPFFGRMLIKKQFQGALDATSRGEMLAVRTAVKGSAGYVAMELVTGTIEGRQGTFILQHSGSMNQGASELDVRVISDSATGELAGLAGRVKIDIVEGVHYYDFDYTLPELPASS
jgi:hypothetical protein